MTLNSSVDPSVEKLGGISNETKKNQIILELHF